jgi:hypothetical protein
MIRVKKVTVADAPFSQFFNTYKTVFVSDIHASKNGIRERLLLKKINEISPDIILLGGDYVAWGGDYSDAFSFLSRLRASKEIFGVLGDSDYQDSKNACEFCHCFNGVQRKTAVLFLKNNTIFFSFKRIKIAITGIEIFHKDTSVRNKILQRRPSCPEIIISHRQLDLDTLPNKPLLVLSGDTHGGQVYIPDEIWSVLFTTSKGAIRSGFFEEGKRKLFVTRGIGTNRLPMRFLCPPEIIIFKGK